MEMDGISMKKAFSIFDKSRNKTISTDEFFKGLKSLGIQADETQAKELIRMFDQNMDGNV